MIRNLRTYDYFKRRVAEPLEEIICMLQNPDHPEHENLKADIDEIGLIAIHQYAESRRMPLYFDTAWDQYLENCTLFFVDNIQTELARERLKAIRFDPLMNLSFHKSDVLELANGRDHLIDTRNFSVHDNGFQYKQRMYRLMPLEESPNSGAALSALMGELIETKGLHFQIRLDPFLETNVKNWRSFVYVPELLQNKLYYKRFKHVNEDIHHRFFYEEAEAPIRYTDIAWTVEGDEVHFTCEEIPSDLLMAIRACRVFEATFIRDTGILKHCSGGIRQLKGKELVKKGHAYAADTWERRFENTVPVFTMDGFTDIKTFMLLATNFFVWNRDVFKYFNSYVRGV